MTIWQYALYHTAARRMTRYERQLARVLAEQAEAGDKNAFQAFRQLAEEALFRRTKQKGH
jgi:hypothetical protein